MSWPTSKIDNIAEVVTKGTTPTTYGMPFVDSGVNFIKAEALNGDSALDGVGFAFVSESTHERLKRSILAEGDVLVTIAGAQVGRCGIVRTEHLPANTNQAVGIIRVHRKSANPWFVYYFFKNPQTFRMCQGIGGQAAQPNINLTVLKGFHLPLPDLRTQHAIVEVLSTYDDLIENYRRRIALLEEAARLLYREWFVRLRFPGHEHTKMADGVPEGWERTALGNIGQLYYGKALRADDRIDGDFPVFGSSGIVGTHHEPYLQGPGIIVGRKGNVGSVYWTDEDFWPIDTVYFLEPSAVTLYIYYTLQNVDFISTDVAVPGLNRNFARSRTVLMPSGQVRDAFDGVAEPLHKQISLLQKENESLSRARDLLLPRLMNGEISV